MDRSPGTARVASDVCGRVRWTALEIDAAAFQRTGESSLSATTADAIRAPTDADIDIASSRAVTEKPTPVVGDTGTRTKRPKVRPP
jgi:hypothetical protein